MSWVGRYPKSRSPATSELYSAESEVKGTSLNTEIVGLTGPEYEGLGTMVTSPAASKLVRCQGPSTICHSGLVAYVVSELLVPDGLAGSYPACFDRNV